MKSESEHFSALLSSLQDQDSPGEAALAVELVKAAQCLLQEGHAECPDAGTWHRYLNCTGTHHFLRALPGREYRCLWAETTFQAVLRSGYSLENMLADRAQRHPERILFREVSGAAPGTWSYAEIERRLRILAGLFRDAEVEPHVAIFCENSIDSACCDLACLAHRIFDTPLNIHFDTRTLAWIFDHLRINIAVADTEERIQRLREVRARTRRPFRIFVSGPGAGRIGGTDCESLQEACARLDLDGLNRRLESHRIAPLTEPATVMFTSGSTGEPKGIVFTQYQLITKRFARAAALPGVGNHEVLLCYLPLFHTFGRYLEMLGALYWGGTYVFAGNPSVETLISQLQQVNPTGLIGVPLRWTQIRDFCLERAREPGAPGKLAEVLRSVVGDSLRWGLSAAGYLDPKVFRFFQKHGVDLCSGFGMTEATGGVTMTPPGEYVDGAVGIALPGIRIRFGAQGELEIAGPYVARYLDETETEVIPAQDPQEDYWLATGDLFKEHASGHLEIVDRIKDIYKNNRGQTVAPRRVEQKFDSVPGIQRVFLVGDRRESNVLLIVPDLKDKVLQAPEGNAQEYFHQIVAAANADLAPYERVVSFAVLDRDFQIDRGELTPKGSYRRKTIEENFTDVIETLYRGNSVDLVCSGMHVRIPRWILRESGLLESEIVAGQGELFCTRTQRRLPLVPRGDTGTVLIGDLEYKLTGSVVDLGLFARQPQLWVGNPALAAFCPCRDGWDLPVPNVEMRVWLPWRDSLHEIDTAVTQTPAVRDQRLRRIHRICADALLLPQASSLAALELLGEELRSVDDREAGVIRQRLEALARHPAEQVRCLAYRVLLTDETMPADARVFPAFVNSGLTFLNEDSIRKIASTGLGNERLEALRQRLFSYRTQLHWPASPVTREQFEKIFGLLSDFARRDPSYMGPVRAELASWALHRQDPGLAAAAESRLSQLQDWYDSVLAAGPAPADVVGKIILDDSLSEASSARIEKILLDPIFLKQSILLAFDEADFNLGDVPHSGIWVSRILSQHQFDLFRVGINLRSGKHFDLLLVVGEVMSRARVRDTIYWLMALSEHPSQDKVVPRFGACSPDHGAISVAYISDLTVWDKIREYAGAQTTRAYFPTRHDWRRLFVRGMAAFFAVWKSSGRRIIPGSIAPANVVVPDADFREGAFVLSLTGLRPYGGPRSIVRHLVRNFYRQAGAHYPRISCQLEISWIFDACIESLGFEDGSRFLEDLKSELARSPLQGEEEAFSNALTDYCERLRELPYMPLPLLCAIERYSEWETANPHATPEAREEEVEQLYRIYRINRFPVMLRYRLYQRTFFTHAGASVDTAFDRLLMRLFRRPGASPLHLEELSSLQAALADPADREVFSRMVFPQARGAQHLEVLSVGESERKQVFVRSEITDRRGARYSVREPLMPSEVGQLYRLLRDADYPREISEQDRHVVIVDEGEQVLGGIVYISQEKEVVYLVGLVVAASLKGRGIGSALLEDFCVRLTARRVRMLKTDFLLRPFLTPNGFHVDSRCGGLVRHLPVA